METPSNNNDKPIPISDSATTDLANELAKRIIDYGKQGKLVPDSMTLLNTVAAFVISNLLDMTRDSNNLPRAQRMADLSAMQVKELVRKVVARVQH